MFLALVLGAVSCQDNFEGLDVNVNGEQRGHINVSLSEDTRANSAFGFDLSTLATDTGHQLRYILEIYLEGSDKVYRDIKFSDNTSVSFPVSIVPNRKYTFAVWADIVKEDANREDGANADLYYDTSKGLKNISIIDHEWNAMDEKRDAFTNFATLETGNLSEVNSIILTRPFAKIRVVTNDIESILAKGIEPKSAKVTYTQPVYRHFDATTATASDAVSKEHTYTTFLYSDNEGEMTLFTDYLLVNETYTTKFDIDVFSDENCTNSIKQNSFDTEISLARNKVTTIKGNILTDGNISDTTKPANNEIWYTNGSTTEPTTPYNTDVFGANIVSNTFDAVKECWVIKFDGDVTAIGPLAFAWCDSLTSITIPDNVTSIGEDAFSCCSGLTSVTIPDSVTTIGDDAFWDCSSLTSVTIPDSVTEIGYGAFCNCSSLREFNGKYASEDGRCLIIDGILNSFAPAGLTEYTIPNSVTEIGKWSLYNCSSLTSVTIPDSVITIEDGAFCECSNLTSVTIPDSVITIKEHAFDECSSLTTVEIGNSVTTIGNYAFNECSGLTTVEIPDSVTTIGEYAFALCNSLTSVTIPDSVTTIEESAFRNSKNLTSVTIGNGLTTIEFSVFCGCSNLTNVTIGNSVTTIGDQAFCDCSNLTSVNIPDSVITIGWAAFSECNSLTNLNIGNSVTTIEDWAFYECSSLTTIDIPNSVTTIGDGAFCDCSSLTSATIGNGVTNIESYAFDYCVNLTSVYCKATTTPNAILDFDGYWDAFDYNATGRKIYVPAESVEAYKSAEHWSEYADDIIGYDFENGVVAPTKPANNEIWYTNGSTTVATTPYRPWGFNATIKSNTYDTTKECWVIKFEGNVTEIVGAFTNCSGLTSITIPDSTTVIGYETFCNCNNITKVNIPDGILAIGDIAFYGCSSLTNVTIPDGINWIGTKAFQNCSSLTSVYCKATTPPEGYSNMFDDNAPGRKIYVPAESVAAYKSAEYWRDYADYIEGYNF